MLILLNIIYSISIFCKETVIDTFLINQINNITNRNLYCHVIYTVPPLILQMSSSGFPNSGSQQAGQAGRVFPLWASPYRSICRSAYAKPLVPASPCGGLQILTVS